MKVILNIAGVPVRLAIVGLDTETARDIAVKYRNFSCGRDAAGGFPVDLRSKEMPGISNGKIHISETRGKKTIKGRGMDMIIYPETAKGRVFPNIHIIDSLLRVVYSKILIDRCGFLIHAAGACGKIFTGPSGSGKTTSVRHEKGILGDDIVALKKEGSRWYIHSTPFTGEYCGEIEKKKERLKELHILSSSRNMINQGELYGKLLRNIVYFFADTRDLGKLMEYCEDISTSIPGYGAKNKALIKKVASR
ncbi:MAG: hypothetical protein JXJ19_00010 [Elusimicrobia bacterium]|nr:hypothetical protein [Elusimicrobiota bacterium]